MTSAVQITDNQPTAVDTVKVFILPDCPECGGEPRLSLVRARKLTKHVLCRADVFTLAEGDLLGAYCLQCEQRIEIAQT